MDISIRKWKIEEFITQALNAPKDSHLVKI